MLHAIGVYVIDSSNGEVIIKKTQHAQKDKGLFSWNQLENIDKRLYKSDFYFTMQSNRIYEFEVDNEFNYFCKLSSCEKIVAIASRRRLDPEPSDIIFETRSLFRNIEQIIIRPKSVKVTLDDIILNPLGYIGKDILIEEAKDGLAKVKEIMMSNIDKVILRGEKIETLLEKTEHLNLNAVKFKEAAKKTNSHCCWIY